MTARNNVNAIRRTLKKNPDGLSIPEISEATGIPIQYLHNAAQCMDDLYVDRWAPNKTGRQWVMVYCLWEKPPVPPKPAVKVAEYARAAA